MKRKLDESIESTKPVVKKGCYFQNYLSVLFRKENRMNAFERMKRMIQDSKPKPIVQAVCCNCQQLKKENQRLSPGKACYFCEKFVCYDCVQKCVNCEYDFCSFCSIQMYDKNDTCKCLNC